MNPLYDAMLGLAPNQDAELIEGYQRYATLLTTVLTPQQIETYAEYIQRSGTIRVFEELTPEEFAELTAQENVIATTIIADEDAAKPAWAARSRAGSGGGRRNQALIANRQRTHLSLSC